MSSLNDLSVHHTGYVVEDLNETIEYLEAEYGLAFGQPYEFRPDRAWAYGQETKDYVLKIAMAETAGGILEFIEPVSGNGVHRQFLESGKSGIQHICFSVKEYDKWHAFFEKKNARIVFEAEVEDERFGYRRCFYAEDKITGMMFEVKEEPYFRK